MHKSSPSRGGAAGKRTNRSKTRPLRPTRNRKRPTTTTPTPRHISTTPASTSLPLAPPDREQNHTSSSYRHRKLHAIGTTVMTMTALLSQNLSTASSKLVHFHQNGQNIANPPTASRPHSTHPTTPTPLWKISPPTHSPHSSHSPPYPAHPNHDLWTMMFHLPNNNNSIWAKMNRK